MHYTTHINIPINYLKLFFKASELTELNKNCYFDTTIFSFSYLAQQLHVPPSKASPTERAKQREQQNIKI